jgi:hypothetical protein
MALESFIDQALSFFNTDIIAIYDQNFNQLFIEARPLKVTPKPAAKLMEHPVEDGSTTTDHRVILPIELEISLLISSADYSSVYDQIVRVFRNSTFLTVITKAASYDNLIIESLPHDEDPETFDILTMALKLKEVQFATSQETEYNPKNNAQKSTVDRGTQQGKTVPEGRTSVAKRIFS